MIGNYIKAVAAAVSRSTAKLMKTGQTTSYRTGDDGDLEAGRDVSFTVLAENNPFGNTNRFTDELGGQTYTNDIVIDWSTYDGSNVLGWYRIVQTGGLAWSTAIDNCLIFSIGTFTTGWRLPNVGEYFSILNFGAASLLNYNPLNISSVLTFWSATTPDNATTSAYQIGNVTSPTISNIAKTTTSSNRRYMICRTFTVTGTTLS